MDKKDIQIFANSEFGKIRTFEEEGKFWFVGSDIAKALGYARPNDAVNAHCRYTAKRSIPHPQGKGTMQVNIIPEGDVYRLIAKSELPAAEKFESWVFDEVLPTLRRTGSYTIRKDGLTKDELQAMRVQTMAENSRNRRAKLWMQLAVTTDIPEFRQIASAYAANTLAGKTVVELPEVKERTLSATDVGNILGVSANKVGKLANKYNLKTEEYGKWVADKSRYSTKQVETFRYYEHSIEKFKEAMEKDNEQNKKA